MTRFAPLLALACAALSTTCTTLCAQVPLVLWTTPNHPAGIDLGVGLGSTLGDYDGDGWVDLFVLQSGQLWQNEGGKDFRMAADLRTVLPSTPYRYSGHFGDYNNDGLPDLACGAYAPNFTACFGLLRNQGQGKFTNVGVSDASFPRLYCEMTCETICWGDLDGDGNIDLFLPSYPLPGRTSNVFLYNQGPSGPNGIYRFEDRTTTSGLANSTAYPKPEGAQFCDMDGDGDLDLFSNCVLYHNLTVAKGQPQFAPLLEFPDPANLVFDEGALFCDYDLDGDFDLLVAFVSPNLGVKLFENRGDGTFFDALVIPKPELGAGLGMSAADFDGDGDIDLNTRDFFRRNTLAETGKPGFEIAWHFIPTNHVDVATISWADLDRDGDLDAFIGNYGKPSRLYRNYTNDAIPAAQQRHVRVVPVRDSAQVPGGLRNEFGAVAEIRVVGEELRRRQFTSSSAGYLNQNEYGLHFSLPPTASAETRFDVSVDFPGVADEGFCRVDKRVNPALGNLRLADLLSWREITVFRSGKIILKGKAIPAIQGVSPQLDTTSGGLVRAEPGVTPPAPKVEPANTWVGVAFDTATATGPLRVVELIVDGELEDPTPCSGESFNLALWDVTSGSAPTRVHQQLARTSPRNDRTFIATDCVLLPGRTYRLVARVKRSRQTAIGGGAARGPLLVLGGVRYQASDACSESEVEGATVDPGGAYVALRFASGTGRDWSDLGYGLAGSQGTPALTASGALVGGQTVELQVTGASPSTPGFLVVGSTPLLIPFLGGTLVPADDLLVQPFATDARGGWKDGATWPSGAPALHGVYVQVWMADPGGASASNALVGVTR